MLLRRHATIADYLTTIPRLPCDYSGHCRRAARGFSRSSGEGAPLVRAGGLAAGAPEGRGRRWLERRRAAPRICERGHECGRVISRQHGECLYLPRNCPLNARLRSRSIPIYPRYKRAVYARFRGGISRRRRKPPRETWARSTGRRFIRRLGWAVGTLRRWATLVRLEARRSCRRSGYLQRVQPPTAGAGGTPPSRRQRKAPAGFEPIGAVVYLEFFAASMSIKNGIIRI